MGYNDIIFGGISAAASRYDFGLYYYRPESAEEIYPTVKQWLSEPQAGCHRRHPLRPTVTGSG